MERATQAMVACEKHFGDDDFVINHAGHKRLKKGWIIVITTRFYYPILTKLMI